MGACESMLVGRGSPLSSRARGSPSGTGGGGAGGNGNTPVKHKSSLLKRLPSVKNRGSLRSSDTANSSTRHLGSGVRANNQSNTSLVFNQSDTPPIRLSGAAPSSNAHNRNSLRSCASMTSVDSIPENGTVVRPRPLSIKANTKPKRPYSLKANKKDQKIDEIFLLFEHEEMDFDLAMSQQRSRPPTLSTILVPSSLMAADSSMRSENDETQEEEEEDKRIEKCASALSNSEDETTAATSATVTATKSKIERSMSSKLKRAGRSFFKPRSKSYIASEALDAQDPIILTPDMSNLLACIAQAESRRKLIHQIMAIQGGLSVQVRFIAAVEQFEDTHADLTEQKRLGDSIVSIFLEEENGRFSVQLSEETRKHLVVDGYLNFLPYAKLQVLQELSCNEEVMDMIGEGGKLVKKTRSASQQSQTLSQSQILTPELGE